MKEESYLKKKKASNVIRYKYEVFSLLKKHHSYSSLEELYKLQEQIEKRSMLYDEKASFRMYLSQYDDCGREAIG